MRTALFSQEVVSAGLGERGAIAFVGCLVADYLAVSAADKDAIVEMSAWGE